MPVWINKSYIGRFAPSPTGPLHLGSLYTALASFLQARSRHGKWLLRIDDLDTPRNIKGSADSILKTLDAFGLHWDDSVVYQSQHLGIYDEILDKLAKNKLVYPCSCSRKTLTAIYSGLCRNKQSPRNSPYSLRIKTDERIISFDDELQGLISHNLALQHGDFILKRKDRIIAYQFAVVIDDDRQQVNHIVRGFDLLESTPRQIYLQKTLGIATPGYMHVPVIIDEQGYKLSKQTRATAVDVRTPEAVIFGLLKLLKQNPPRELQHAPSTEQLNWAIDHWDPALLKNSRAISSGFQ
ncbi:MAG: tRNA glutamyl-Q(34) synthetase GluQRS [Methylococcales bacterium]|nr:tRNA glutamyl-Q(34) synthetase GluQRS [Methylococcales bacterium]